MRWLKHIKYLLTGIIVSALSIGLVELLDNHWRIACGILLGIVMLLGSWLMGKLIWEDFIGD